MYLPYLWALAVYRLWTPAVAADAADAEDPTEAKYGVRYASRCEACRVVADELVHQLQETGRSHDVLRTGYHDWDSERRRPQTATKYRHSELRLLEVLESACAGILKYSVHKERTDSTRFARGISQTFQTLHGLVDKGVKVDLGIPHELWDKPSAEITDLKSKCDALLEDYEEVIEEWYRHHQDDVSLSRYLCSQHVLDAGEDGCLADPPAPPSPPKPHSEL